MATSILAFGNGQAIAKQHGGDVQCGDTITADTELHADLVNCPNNGIVIGADNIELDLNGHTIDGVETGECGPPFEGTSGVSNADGHDGITVENGTIREFARGVSGGFSRSGLDDLTLRDNRIAGMEIGGPPEDNLNDNRIEDNLVTGNGCVGIEVFEASGNRIEDNRIEDSGFDGLSLFHSDANVIVGNELSRNGVFGSGEGNGASLSESNHNVVKKNSASGNGDTGLSTFDANHNLIAKNSFEDNSFVGLLLLDDSDDNRAEQNFASGNGLAGIVVNSGEPELTADGNVVWKNTANENLGSGILIDDGTTGTLVERNRASDNGQVGGEGGDDGILVKVLDATLTKNTANDNADLGIEAVPGVTDGGGNKAHGNGNPAQCLNIACK